MDGTCNVHWFMVVLVLVFVLVQFQLAGCAGVTDALHKATAAVLFWQVQTFNNFGVCLLRCLMAIKV
jgi:hypothetical protein